MLILKNNFRPGDKIPHDFLNTLANFWNELQVVSADNVTLRRQSDGHHTTIGIGGPDVTETTDAEGYITAPAEGSQFDSGRKTIERNPQAGHHNDELQLHNVQSVANWTNSIPYMESVARGTAFNMVDGTAVLITPNQYRTEGTLAWAVIDGHSDTDPTGTAPVLTSLEIVSGTLQVGTFRSAGTCCVPYIGSNGTTGDKWLDWRSPVKINGDAFVQGTTGTFDVLGVGGTVGAQIIQITFPSRRCEVLGGAINVLPEVDRTMSLQYQIVGDLKGTIGTATRHDNLDWNSGGALGTFASVHGSSCSDHDGRYFRRGDVGASQNYCNTLGNYSTFGTAVVVDLNSYKLNNAFSGTAVNTLDWKDQALIGTWSVGGISGTGTIACGALVASGTISCAVLASSGTISCGTQLVIGGTKVVGTRQTDGTFSYSGIGSYVGIDNGFGSPPAYAANSNLNALKDEVNTIGSYLAGLKVALQNHGLIT